MKPARRRDLVVRVIDRYPVSQRRACRLLSLHRSTCRYRSCRRPDTAERMRLRELAHARPRYGYRRLHWLMRREGWRVNEKKILRIYREEGLLIRTRRRRKQAATSRVPLDPPDRVYQRWSLDFMSDQLASGGRIRILNVVDQLSRECLAAEVRTTFPAKEVTQVLERLIAIYGRPESLTADNGSEFTSRHFDSWAYHHGITIDFIRPGKPVENAFVESFNGTVRDECLSLHWFQSLDEAATILARWRAEYNETRPHSSLGYLAPIEYVAQLISGE